MKKLLIFAISCAAVSASAQSIVYSNIDTWVNQSGSAITDSATVGSTKYREMLCDDINLLPSALGQQLSVVKWMEYLNSSALGVTTQIRIYVADGASGAPGTLVGSWTSAPAVSSPTGLRMFSADFTDQNLILPSTHLWFGIYFQEPSTATLNMSTTLAEPFFNPPTVGSSENKSFFGNTFGPQDTNNPSGGLFFGTTGPVQNYGIQLQSVPEPASICAMVLGLAALARRRRR